MGSRQGYAPSRERWGRMCNRSRERREPLERYSTMIRHDDDPLQDPQRRRRTKPPRTNKVLRDKIRMGKWRRDELEWLLAHLGPELTPIVAAEIHSKLQTMQARKGVPRG
jgi:hypothetical protein